MNQRFIYPFWVLLGLLLFFSACSTTDKVQVCNADATVLLEPDICLVFGSGAQLEAEEDNIETIIRESLIDINTLMPLDPVLIRIVTDPNLVIPEIGVGGYNPSTDEVLLSINPDFPDLASALQTELPAQLAHELHHAQRRRSVGYGSTLLEACVSEGLADAFSIEVTGIAPPIWSTALQDDTLQHWIDVASESWNEQGYGHSDWFLGANPSIPRWAGYAIGFELVRNYLLAHPELQPSDLVGERAESFLP